MKSSRSCPQTGDVRSRVSTSTFRPNASSFDEPVPQPDSILPPNPEIARSYRTTRRGKFSIYDSPSRLTPQPYQSDNQLTNFDRDLNYSDHNYERDSSGFKPLDPDYTELRNVRERQTGSSNDPLGNPHALDCKPERRNVA